MDEFRNKIQTVMPTIPKNEPQGKSDFKTVREVFEYIIEEDKKAKQSKDSWIRTCFGLKLKRDLL